MGLICEKCGKYAYSKGVWQKEGKYGQIYKYFRFIHYRKGKKKGRWRPCYIPVKES